MQTFISIVATFFLLFWPLMFMMSPMMFDAPGSENDKSNVINMMLMLGYPVYIFFFMWIFGLSYFGISSFKLLIISIVVILLGFSLFGYFGILSNLLKGINNSGYSIVEQQVYYDGRPIEADTASFTILDAGKHSLSASYYAKDHKHFYYDGKPVENAIPENIRPLNINRQLYWLNDSQVIYDDKIIPDAEPANFHGIDGFYAWTYSNNKDRFQVYCYGEPLPPVDRDSFIPLNDFYAKDKQQVFYKHEPVLADADAETFELFENHDFARDKNHVYYLSTQKPHVIEGADPASFEIYHRGYMKDINHVYHEIQYERIEIMEQADVTSFEETQYDDETRSEARDRNHYYYDGKVVGNRS